MQESALARAARYFMRVKGGPYVYKVLPPSQNVRRLSFSQKSTSSKFNQVYIKIYEYLQYSMDVLRNYTLW
jgi:hypothetical protein